MRSINLLPPEAFERAKTRRRVFQVILIGVAYVALLVLLTILWQGRVNRAEEKVTAQQDVNAGVQSQVAALADAQGVVERYNENVVLVIGALANDVSWGRILNDLGRMLPERAWLESFTGAASEAFEGGAAGSVVMSGIGFDFPDVSALLRSLDSDRFPSVSGTWVTSVAKVLIGEAEVVSFASSTSLTAASQTDRLLERIPEVVP